MQPRVDTPGAEAAAARRSVGHRPPGAHDRAGAEADEPDAVRARQYLRADRGRAAGRGAARQRRRSRNRSRRRRSPSPSRALTLPDAQNAPPAPPRTQQTPRRPGGRRDRRRDPQRPEVRAAGTASRTRRAAISRKSRRRSSSTRRASSSGRGCAGSSRRSAATGSSRTRRCRCAARVVVTFYVHKDGRITDLQVLRPSPIDAFNRSAQQRDPRVDADACRCRRSTRTSRRSSR